MKNKKTLSFIVAFALMVSAATLLISATSALGSGSFAIRFSAEQEGGAGYYREASVIGGSASGKFLVFQVTSGEAEDAAVTVTAIQLSGTSSAIISYQKPDSFVEAWLAEGLPDLTGGGDLGTEIYAYNNSDTPEPVFAIEVTQSAGGAIALSPDVTQAVGGTQITATFTADAGYRFVKGVITIDGAAQNVTSATYTFTVAGNVTVTAEFTPVADNKNYIFRATCATSTPEVGVFAWWNNPQAGELTFANGYMNYTSVRNADRMIFFRNNGANGYSTIVAGEKFYIDVTYRKHGDTLGFAVMSDKGTTPRYPIIVPSSVVDNSPSEVWNNMVVELTKSTTGYTWVTFLNGVSVGSVGTGSMTHAGDLEIRLDPVFGNFNMDFKDLCVYTKPNEKTVVPVTRSWLSNNLEGTKMPVNMFGDQVIYGNVKSFDQLLALNYDPMELYGYTKTTMAAQALLWRTDGNPWRLGNLNNGVPVNIVDVEFLQSYELTDIWLFDGGEYHPATPPTSGPQLGNPQEASGGKMRVYAIVKDANGQMTSHYELFTYTLTNGNVWHEEVLSQPVTIGEGMEYTHLRFEKVNTDVYYWQNDSSIQYPCDVNIARAVLLGNALSEEVNPDLPHGITVNAPNGRIVPSQNTAPKNTRIDLPTIVANPGYTLVPGSLKINGTPITGMYFMMPYEDVVITADFVPTSVNVGPRDLRASSLYRTYEAASSAEVTMKYRLFVPEGPAQLYPVVVYLHGNGQEGTNNEAQIAESVSFLEHLTNRDYANYPAILIMPQLPGYDNAKNVYTLRGLIDSIYQEFAGIADPDRLYIMGVSNGAGDSLGFVANNIDLVAATAPIAPRQSTFLSIATTPAPAVYTLLKDMPIWMFHGGNDGTIPVTQGGRPIYAALQAAGSTVVRYTEIPGGGHAIWGAESECYGYVDPSDGKTLLQWMFAQRRVRPVPDTDYIKVAQAMIVPRNLGAGVDDTTVPAKFKLFNEYAKVVANPPGTASAYKTEYNGFQDTVSDIWRTGGDNWRQLLGGNQTFAGVEQFELDFGCEVRLSELWILDGKPYAQATITQAGDSDYEVMGGKFQIWGWNSQTSAYVSLGEHTLQNNHQWVLFDLTGSNGFTTQKLKFVKVNTGNRYSWTGGGWTSDPMYYVCDVCVPEVSIKGVALGQLTEDDPEVVFRVPQPSAGLGGVVDHKLTFKKIVGSNTHASDNANDWVSDGIYAPFGSMREYHNWGWSEYTTNDGTGNSDAVTKQSGQIAMFRDLNWWGNPTFEDYYKKCYDNNVDVVICVQGGAIGAPTIPAYQADKSKVSAASYLAHSQSMFQLAARFGNTVVDASRLSVAPGQVKKTGLGYIKYYEDWNEPNATWETLGDKQFSGAMYAAMLSADYDGHMNTMGPNAGVKNADPTAKMVMAGLVGYPDTLLGNYENSNDTLRFMYDMINWFQANRTEEKWYAAGNPAGSWNPKLMYPFDVVNGHHYSPDGNTTGCSPEENDVYGRMTRFVDFCHEYFPWCEVWLSEFGWETGAQGKSPQSATAESTGSPYAVGINKGLTIYDVQARWIVREYLTLSAAGIDRSHQYGMPNHGGLDSPDTGGRHMRPGFFNVADGLKMSRTTAKMSWWYAATMSNALGDMSYTEVVHKPAVSTSQTDPWVFKFTPDTDTYDGGTEAVYALWLGSSKGDVTGTLANLEGAGGEIGYDSTRVSYDLEVGAGVTEVTFIHLQDKSEYGIYETVPVVNGKVSVVVTERPVFVVVGETQTPPPPPSPRIYLNTMTITGAKSYGFSGWAEQETRFWGDIMAGEGSTNMHYYPSDTSKQGSNWSVYGGDTTNPPQWILFNFNAEKHITDIAVYYTAHEDTANIKLQYCANWSGDAATSAWVDIPGIDLTTKGGDWQGTWVVFKGLSFDAQYVRIISTNSTFVADNARVKGVTFWGAAPEEEGGDEAMYVADLAGKSNFGTYQSSGSSSNTYLNSFSGRNNVRKFVTASGSSEFWLPVSASDFQVGETYLLEGYYYSSTDGVTPTLKLQPNVSYTTLFDTQDGPVFRSWGTWATLPFSTNAWVCVQLEFTVKANGYWDITLIVNGTRSGPAQSYGMPGSFTQFSFYLQSASSSTAYISDFSIKKIS